jgi:hypothetical protein
MRQAVGLKSRGENPVNNCVKNPLSAENFWAAMSDAFGVGGGGDQKNADGTIVFPGELRMYHQRHLNWRHRSKK